MDGRPGHAHQPESTRNDDGRRRAHGAGRRQRDPLRRPERRAAGILRLQRGRDRRHRRVAERGPDGLFGGRSHNRIVEGDVVTQNGVGCLLAMHGGADAAETFRP